MDEDERNVGWILAISIIMYFLSMLDWLRWISIGRPPLLDVWTDMQNMSTLFFILTIASSGLFQARFWNTKVTYRLSVLFFTVAMGLLFAQSIRWLA
ncbi:MAG: hypothetical protein PVF15_09425 [Candidatus Bathyarchaeota archaeon]